MGLVVFINTVAHCIFMHQGSTSIHLVEKRIKIRIKQTSIYDDNMPALFKQELIISN